MPNSKQKLSIFSYSLLCVFVLSACSSEADRREANRDFDYTAAKLQTRLTTPALLAQPTYSNEYQLPVETRKGPVGKDVDVRPPEQIMAFASNSRPSSSMNDTSLWFSARSLSQPIGDDIWSALNTYINVNQFPVVSKNEQSKTVIVGPVSVDFEAEHPEDIPPAPAQYYQFSVKDESQLHQAGVSVQWVKPAEGNAVPSTFEQKHYATRLLNKFSAYADTVQRNATPVNMNNPIELMLGQDNSGSKAIVANNPYAQTWQWLITVLPQAGLPIEQSSQSQGLIVFHYTGDNSVGFTDLLTFWKPVQETNGLSLSEGRYRLQLADRGTETSVTLLDDSNKPVLVTAVERLYSKLQGYTGVNVHVAEQAANAATATPVAVAEIKPIHVMKSGDDWVADTAASTVMKHLPEAVTKAGFVVGTSSSDSLNAIYKMPEENIWDALAIWKPIAPRYEGLAEGQYIFTLVPHLNGTAIRMTDASGAPVPAQLSERILGQVAAGIDGK